MRYSHSYSHIRAFHHVAIHGGFNAAARALNVGQPTVSSQVKGMERAAGVLLFERGPRSTTLTREGERLFEITSRLFGVQDEVESLLRILKDEASSHLRLGSDAPYSVGRVAAAYGHEKPEMQVLLTMGRAEDIEQQLRDETLDLAILVRNASSRDLHRVAYTTHEIVLLVGASHAWAGRRSVMLEELQGQAMALRDATYSLTSTTFEQALERAGIEPIIAMSINNRENLREAVAAGAGIGVGIASDAESDFRLRPIAISNTRLTITDYLVCKRARSGERAIREFFALAMQGARTDRREEQLHDAR